MYAVLALLKHFPRSAIRDGPGLKSQQAGDDLKVVLDTMMNFLEKDLLFAKRCTDRLVRNLARSDIAQNDGKEPSIVDPSLGNRRLGGKLNIPLAQAKYFATLSHGASGY